MRAGERRGMVSAAQLFVENLTPRRLCYGVKNPWFWRYYWLYCERAAREGVSVEEAARRSGKESRAALSHSLSVLRGIIDKLEAAA